jgi:predicted Zn-dependent protease
MKILRTVFVIFIVLMGLHPVSLVAAESEISFRQRISTSDEDIMSDITEEIRFGREVAARVIARYGIAEDPALMKYVNLVGRVLARTTNRPELTFHFAVLNTDEINAYAAPGGYVFVTRGALLKMHDESELAGVLAHEIGHIVEKHVVRELKIRGADSSAAMGLAALIGGSSQSARTAFAQAVDKAMDMLFKDGYKREDEVQADGDAVMFCAFSGYEPTALVTYFSRLNALKGKNTEVLDMTHPSYGDRIAWLKETITREGLNSGTYETNRERFAANISTLK